MSKILNKLQPIIYVISVCIIMYAIYIKYYERNELYAELIGVTQEYKQISKQLAALKVQYEREEKLIEKLIKDNQEALKVIDQNLETIKIISQSTYSISEKARKSKNPDLSVVDSEDGATIIHELRYENGPAIGYVMITPDGEFTSKLYNHEYRSNLVVTKVDNTGKYKLLSNMDYILKSPSINLNGEQVWTNKPYKLKITNGEAMINPIEYERSNRFMLWSPSIQVISTLSGFGLGVSIAGFGKSNVDHKYKFLQIGIHKEYDGDKYSAIVTPVLVRPFDKYLTNTYFGTGFKISEDTTKLMFSVQIGL